MKKLPLQNTETNKIPIGPRIKAELARAPRHHLKSSKRDESHGYSGSLGQGGGGECPLAKPTSFTMSKLKKVIDETRSRVPNFDRMVEDKLASPHTAKYIRKKKASKVNIAESAMVYQELVSLDVSGTNLIANIEEDLRRKACHVHPTARTPDPSLPLADYFKEEEFVNVRRVGTCDIFPLPASKQTFTSQRQKLGDYTDLLLGKEPGQT